MTIGGNDLGFGPVIMGCIMKTNGSLCRSNDAPADLFDGTLGQMVDANLAELSDSLPALLSQIQSQGTNARIQLLGYPTLFEGWSECVGVLDIDRLWLNEVSAELNAVLTEAVEEARSNGVAVTYQSPQ